MPERTEIATAPPAPRRGPTMIKNLIPSLPERGKVKIGVKGEMITSKRGNQFQPPQKLDHFTVTTLQRGSDGNFLRDEAFHAKYGERPTEIPIRLLYDDPALNYPTRYACFIGRTLWCSGDGETATRLTGSPQGLQDAKNIVPHEVPCPCHRQEPTYDGRDRCKMNGNLSVLIEGMGGVGGVWRFRTTSYNSIVGIMSSMAFIRSVTGGVLANIPLLLRLQPKQATNPQDPTQSVTIYVVNLEFAGDIAELQGIGHQIALARATTHMSIAHIEDEARRVLAIAPPTNAPLPGDDADDVVEEFYPEQAADPDAAPPRPRRSDYVAETEPATTAPSFPIIDADGQEIGYPTAEAAEDALIAVFEAAARRGRAALDAASENNAQTIAGLPTEAAERIDAVRRAYLATIGTEGPEQDAGEVLPPHALPAGEDYSPVEWGGRFIAAVRTAATQAEIDNWCFQNKGILDDIQQNFPKAWRSIDTAIASARAAIGPEPEPERLDTDEPSLAGSP